MKIGIKLLAAAVALSGQPALADDAVIDRWLDKQCQDTVDPQCPLSPSTLARADQRAELQWFAKAAAPFKGMEINVLSETIPTHEYESKVLTKVFEDVTGIKVNHQLLGEGEVVQAVQTQMQTNRNLYDAYINDSDLIGTHSRLQLAVPLSDWMAGEGRDVTNPGLDVDDFMGKSFTTGARRQTLPTARPAIRQPVLVPSRLVFAPRSQKAVPRQIRLRTRRAGQLVGLRGYRRLFHRRCQRN